MSKHNYAIFLCLFAFFCAKAQINYTANEQVKPYNGYFRSGLNIGYNPPYTDEESATMAANAGAMAIRPALPENLTEIYGYNFRVKTYDFYENLGIKENTVLVGYPVDWHRDLTNYCKSQPETKSALFGNLYKDIWDGGKNGTPYNDENYFAAYIYKTVTTYKKYVKFWEIWNEPGFDYAGKGWRLPGDPAGNWWDKDPDPCDYILRAPIQHYVRTLRVAYEVIKYVDPDAYVCLSGTGYASFLDAILRNTDNPDGGKVTTAFPRGGGAYFDVMGFHSYPHFDGSLKILEINGSQYVNKGNRRHSDAAADGIVSYQNTYKQLLAKYGYDGQKYPQKHWIITECNIPRKQFGDYIGSPEVQRNYMIKAFVTCIQNNIYQNHIFALAERDTYETAKDEFGLMGLYQKLDTSKGLDQTLNDEGIAYKTASQLMAETRYDAARTAALQLPAGVRGGAFRYKDGKYVYVIWAATSKDMSEQASANYSFPASLGFSVLNRAEWNYASTKKITEASTQNIALTATPLFFVEKIVSSNPCDNDGQAPVISNCPPNITVAINNPTWAAPTATDNCSTPTLTSNYKSGDRFERGSTRVTYTATDAKGNAATCSFVVTVNPNAPNQTPCKEGAGLFREFYLNQSAYWQSPIEIPTEVTASGSTILTDFKSPTDIGDFYVEQVRGYLTPKETGNYTFYINGDDNVDLYLSSDEKPANKTRIAYVYGWTYSNEFNKYPTQTSKTINLQAGKRYYIELRHSDGQLTDHYQVQWTTPSNTTRKLITNEFLTTYCGGNNSGNTTEPTPEPTPTPVPSVEGVDIALTLTSTAKQYSLYKPITFRLVATNNGTKSASNIQIDLNGPALTDMAFSEQKIPAGSEYFYFKCNQCEIWKIPALSSGQSVTLELTLFPLKSLASQSLTARLRTVSPSDAKAENNTATITVEPLIAGRGGESSLVINDSFSSIFITSIYPAPAIDIANLNIFSDLDKETTLELYDGRGGLVEKLSVPVVKGNNLIQLNVSNLSSGFYYIILSSEGMTKSSPVKLLKNRL